MDDILKKRLQILGLRIAYFRKRRGLTQEQLADKVGMSWSYLAKQIIAILHMPYLWNIYLQYLMF